MGNSGAYVLSPDDAGHSSSAITDRYIDIGLRERHGSAKKKRIKPECMLNILPKIPN